MEAFLKFIIIAILVVYSLGFLSRLLLRYYLKRLVKRHSRFADRFEKRPEGDIKVNSHGRSKKKVDRNIGDYVDYEEI